jgi:hypothetical protein
MSWVVRSRGVGGTGGEDWLRKGALKIGIMER